MDPTEIAAKGAADWKPFRRGLVLLSVGLLAFILGIAAASLCLAVVVLTWSGRSAPPGSDFWLLLAAVGGGVSLVGAVAQWCGAILLRSIPAESRVGRWARMGVVCLPVAIAVPAAMLWCTGDPQAGVGHVGLFAVWMIALAVAAYCWTYSISCILEAAASMWGDQNLSGQFRLCFTVAWCANVIWIAAMAFSRFSEVSVYPGPPVVLAEMGWSCLLLRRLLQRIAKGK